MERAVGALFVFTLIEWACIGVLFLTVIHLNRRLDQMCGIDVDRK